MKDLIDTHLHLIHPDRFHHDWIAQVPPLQKPFTLADYTDLTEGLGVERALFMEVDVREAEARDEAAFFDRMAADPANKLDALIASGRPENADFPAYLDTIASPRLKGLRRVLHTVDADMARGETFKQNIRLLGERALVFDLCVLPGQYDAALELVDACPDTVFMLDHCGIPNLSQPEGFDAWREGLRAFARRPHVNAKLSGVVTSAPEGSVTLERVGPYLDATAEAFGSERLAWGSDWPVCTLTTALPDWIRLFREWADRLNDSERDAVFADNAQRIYGLDTKR